MEDMVVIDCIANFMLVSRPKKIDSKIKIFDFVDVTQIVFENDFIELHDFLIYLA